MKSYNYFLIDFKKKNKNLNNLLKTTKKFLSDSPVIPHFANECLDDLRF